MSPLNFARMLTSLLLDSIAASYDSDDDRILDQVERPRGHKVASLAEVMARQVFRPAIVRKAA